MNAPTGAPGPAPRQNSSPLIAPVAPCGAQRARCQSTTFVRLALSVTCCGHALGHPVHPVVVELVAAGARDDLPRAARAFGSAWPGTFAP